MRQARRTKKKAVEPANTKLSVRQQCRLLGISRSQYYYKPCGESEDNLQVMRIMDRQYTEFPTSGARTMRSVLQDHGYTVNKKRVARLMKVMGIQAIYHKKSLSKLGRAEYIHPYLLRGLHIHKSNQVWSIDITYIAMPNGFMYLVAIIDWYSRKILAWRLSNSLEASESIMCLQEAIQTHGKPDIVNSDQGSQYTCSQ